MSTPLPSPTRTTRQLFRCTSVSRVQGRGWVQQRVGEGVVQVHGPAGSSPPPPSAPSAMSVPWRVEHVRDDSRDETLRETGWGESCHETRSTPITDQLRPTDRAVQPDALFGGGARRGAHNIFTAISSPHLQGRAGAGQVRCCAARLEGGDQVLGARHQLRTQSCLRDSVVFPSLTLAEGCVLVCCLTLLSP